MSLRKKLSLRKKPSLGKKPFADTALGFYLWGRVWARDALKCHVPRATPCLPLPHSSGDTISGPLCVVLRGRVVTRPRSDGHSLLFRAAVLFGVLERFRTSFEGVTVRGPRHV